MTIEEAIKHEYAAFELCKLDAKEYHDAAIRKLNPFEKSLLEEQEEKSIKISQEHRQLAEWLKELKAHREAWNKLQEEMDRLDPDYDSYSVKNNACLIVNKYRPKEGDAE